MHFLGKLFYLFVSRACSSISQAGKLSHQDFTTWCLPVSSLLERNNLLPSCLPRLPLYAFISLYSLSLRRSLYEAWCVGLSLIHKGVSCVLTVQMIINVNLNKSAYQKYFLDLFSCWLLIAGLSVFCGFIMPVIGSLHWSECFFWDLSCTCLHFFFFKKTTLWIVVWFIYGFGFWVCLFHCLFGFFK